MFALRVILLLFTAPLMAQYVGSEACRACHAKEVESQSKTGHARALAAAPKGSPGQWAFGAGAKAITYVSQADRETYIEHGLTYYPALKSMALTPGHTGRGGVRYRTLDPEATTLKCFRCHSTGPLSLGPDRSIQPREPGIHCESCHGPSAEHVRTHGTAGTILNPGRLSAVELNDFCGVCHRKPPESDWTDKWKTRHQPSYLNQAACFRKSGALTCLTCHDPHSTLSQVSTQYDKRCMACHKEVRHRTAVTSRSCVDCHMPQVVINAQLSFTNHWIGIYAKGSYLVPSRSIARSSPPLPPSNAKISAPADPANLRPLFEHALAEEEKENGPNHPRVARSASDLGLFLSKMGDLEAAEAPLRRALEIDRSNRAPEAAADAESLAQVLAETGRRAEAFEMFKGVAAGPDPMIAARSFASLAMLDPEHADEYYRSALAAQEKTGSKDEKQVSVLLNDLAMALQTRKDYAAAEPLFRRALAVQEEALGPDHPATASTLSNFGLLLETVGKLAEAEQAERTAVSIFEKKLGPWSVELATSCTNLADVLWTKGDRVSASSLYRRAISIDESVYGPEHPEVAGDLLNFGLLLKASGQRSEAQSTMHRALAIYEKAFGVNSPEAEQVRRELAPGQQ